MPKDNVVDGPCQCPNPHCSSQTKVFASIGSLNRHMGQKPDCRQYAKQILLEQKTSGAPAKAVLAGMILAVPPANATETAIFPAAQEDDRSDTGSFPMADTTDHIQDYEGFGFANDEAVMLALPGYETTYTIRKEVDIRLLKLCTEMEAPLYAFEEIMNWARHAIQSGYDFVPKYTTYRQQVDRLEVWMGMQNQRPEEATVKLPSKHGEDTIEVTRFDFITQFRSLLSDPVLNRAENLVVQPDDPFQRYVPPNGRLGECLSGSWYNHAWNEMEKDGRGNFMIPIILYIDKTQLSMSGKLSIYPVQMSLGIFTEKVGIVLASCPSIAHDVF
jgi:Plavaka transposase